MWAIQLQNQASPPEPEEGMVSLRPLQRDFADERAFLDLPVALLADCALHPERQEYHCSVPDFLFTVPGA